MVQLTCALGGPGGSSITVTTEVLSALRLFPFQRAMALSTRRLDGLIHCRSELGFSMCCSLDFSASHTIRTD